MPSEYYDRDIARLTKKRSMLALEEAISALRFAHLLIVAQIEHRPFDFVTFENYLGDIDALKRRFTATGSLMEAFLGDLSEALLNATMPKEASAPSKAGADQEQGARSDQPKSTTGTQTHE